jgi:Tfp pilus assembly protein PilO
MAQIGKGDYSRYQHYFVNNLSRFYKGKKSRVYSGAILTLITISFFAFFALKPTASTIAGLLKKIDDQKKVADSLETKINALSQAQEQYNAISSKIYLLDQALPPDSQFDQLTQQIELAHRQTKVKMVDLKFSKIELWGQENDQLGQVEFSLVTQGEYHQLKQLLELLPKLRRIIQVNKFAFQKSRDQDQQDILTLAVSGQAFYLNSLKK